MKNKLFTSKIKTLLIVAVALAIVTTVAVAVTEGTSFSTNVVQTLLQPLVARLERDPKPLQPQTPYQFSPEGEYTETMEVSQGKLAMGFVTPITIRDPEFAAMQVCNIVFGGGMIAVGAISLGTLAAFINYTTQLFDPIQSLARIMAEFQTAQASAERVLSLIDTPLEIVEKPEVIEKFGDNFHPIRENWPPIK